MASPLTWHDERRKLGDLTPRPDNPKTITDVNAARLVQSYEEFEQPHAMLVNPDGTMLDGHQRLEQWIAKFGSDFEVDVRVPSRPLSQKEWQRLTVYLDEGTRGEWEPDMLAGWGVEAEELEEWGMDEETLALILDEVSSPPTLDELAEQYGEPQERDFWPVIKVQVSPDTMELYQSFRDQIGVEDDADAMAVLLGAVDATVLGSGIV